MGQLQKHKKDFDQRGIRIVAVSIEPPAKAKAMKDITRAEYDFFSDPEGKFIDLIGVRHEKGRADGADIARAASVLFDSDGKILWIHVAENYRVRPKPLEILKVADDLFAGESP